MQLPNNSAYCEYYKTVSADLTSTTSYMNTTSQNIYAYATLYASPDVSITTDSILLGKCRTHTPGAVFGTYTCSSSDSNVFTYTSTNLQYILACIECHYLLGPCNFDGYNGVLPQAPTASGQVPCPNCI